MSTTVLSDEVINSTDLRNNQKKWLDAAYHSPVSITSGSRKLVLLNREKAKEMYLISNYAQMLVRFCRERELGKAKESSVFPWVKHLSEKAIHEFTKELLSTFEEAIHRNDWGIFDEMLDSWIATAEAMTNPEMLDLIHTDLSKERFTEVE